ncbi:hypothetical protein OPQ81_000401 [Rhizoctonia solani]|nr:hypothetical protein OPQ81_000401 [Rhizoctonia solani]
MVIIQIENVRFKVHKSKLIKSETFADMFTVAANSNADSQIMEGSSVEHPIKLHGVSASDFECLLTLLYESRYTEQRVDLDISLALPAFRLAHMWNFTELQACLLPYLEENLNDVDKIVCAREFDIREWTIPAYIRICRRPEPLKSEEAEKIGLRGMLLILRLRDIKDPATCNSCKSNGRHVQATSYRCSYGHNWGVGGMIDKTMEETIKAWEENGQVFS